jgi:hypothetical protein
MLDHHRMLQLPRMRATMMKQVLFRPSNLIFFDQYMKLTSETKTKIFCGGVGGGLGGLVVPKIA